jgi:hypothetical protein
MPHVLAASFVERFFVARVGVAHDSGCRVVGERRRRSSAAGVPSAISVRPALVM